jgi:hypothetical protein
MPNAVAKSPAKPSLSSQTEHNQELVDEKTMTKGFD